MKKMILRITSVYVIVIMGAILSSYTVLAQGYEQEINALSTKMADSIVKAERSQIAVVDFTDLQGNVTELGRFIAEEFSVALLSTNRGFEIVDRTHLQILLKEHKLSSTGLIDPATAQKLGEIAGVDALVTGTITPFGESVRLSVKVLDAKTAQLIGANAGNIPATEAIKTLLARGIQNEGTSSPELRTPTPQIQTQQTVEAKGFSFLLQGCERSGGRVICYLLITNNDEDSGLCINDIIDANKASRLFDDLGNGYRSISPQLGKNGGNSSDFAESLLVRGIPMRASVTFEDVSSQAKMIAMLELFCRNGLCTKLSGSGFKVQFRNIPFSK